MAKIHISFSGDVMVFDVIGTFSTDELLACVQENYPKYKPRNVLWDMTQADTPSVNPEQLKHVAQTSKVSALQFRTGGMTAFVSSDPALFSMLCMYALVATMQDMPVEQSIFKNRYEALQWLAQGAKAAEAS